MFVCVLVDLLGVLVDLLGLLVATTNMCTTKLDRFDEIRTQSKCNFKNEFLEMFFQLLEEIIIY